MSNDPVIEYALPASLCDAIDDLVVEWARAKEKHGEKTMDGKEITDLERLAALGEEFGEVCRALTYDKDHSSPLRKELIQVANVAITWATILPKGK